jgi:hypothetical protein
MPLLCFLLCPSSLVRCQIPRFLSVGCHQELFSFGQFCFLSPQIPCSEPSSGRYFGINVLDFLWRDRWTIRRLFCGILRFCNGWKWNAFAQTPSRYFAWIFKGRNRILRLQTQQITRRHGIIQVINDSWTTNDVETYLATIQFNLKNGIVFYFYRFALQSNFLIVAVAAPRKHTVFNPIMHQIVRRGKGAKKRSQRSQSIPAPAQGWHPTLDWNTNVSQ